MQRKLHVAIWACVENSIVGINIHPCLGLEQLVVRAVGRINRGRVVLVKDTWVRNKMLAHPAALLRVYQALSEQGEGEGGEGSGLRACFSCGASSRGLYCSWCSHRK